MDNNEIDKILKEKLKNQIITSKDFEQKIKNTIKEQKETHKKSGNLNKLRVMKYIVSIAAVSLIVFMLGISLNEKGINFETDKIKQSNFS